MRVASTARPRRTREPATTVVARVIAADAVRGREGWGVLLTVQCPYCAGAHTHGGGLELHGQGPWLGFREPRCQPTSASPLPPYALHDPWDCARLAFDLDTDL